MNSISNDDIFKNLIIQNYNFLKTYKNNEELDYHIFPCINLIGKKFYKYLKHKQY